MKNPAGWNNPAQQRLDGLREAYRCRAYWQQHHGRHRFSPVVCIYHDASLVRYVPLSVQLECGHETSPLPIQPENDVMVENPYQSPPPPMTPPHFQFTIKGLMACH